jgi:hypothetical protein
MKLSHLRISKLAEERHSFSILNPYSVKHFLSRFCKVGEERHSLSILNPYSLKLFLLRFAELTVEHYYHFEL